MTVLALDLASVSGWAYGDPGGAPTHGYIRFAKAGSSHEAIFASAMRWMTGMMRIKPSLVVWESPLSTVFRRGRTTTDTTSILFGLPAVIGAVAFEHGVYDLRKADTRDVRNFFIGSNPKRARAKPMVIAQCKRQGWNVTDDNEADALAVWHYQCSIIAPTLALRPAPLAWRVR